MTTTRIRPAELLGKYLKHLQDVRASRGKSTSILTPYSTYAEAFLDWAEGKALTTATVAQWLEWQSHRYKDTSLVFMRGVIRTLFKVNKLLWDESEPGLAIHLSGKRNAPAADPRDVAEMIRAVRGDPSLLEHRCILAVASTYGCRREELSQLRPKHLATEGEDHFLYLNIAKMGDPVLHLLPPEIVGPVTAWGFRKPWSIKLIQDLWLDLEDLAGLDHVPQMGFHSLRRILARLLSDEFGADASILDSYFGWKASKSMRERYAHTEVVSSRHGTSFLQGKYRRDLDLQVYAKHPFLKHWRGED